MYITAAPTTNETGIQFKFDAGFGNFRVAEVGSPRIKIWDKEITPDYEATLGQIMWLADKDKDYLAVRGLTWLRRYHGMMFYLKENEKCSTFTKCVIAKDSGQIKVVIADGKEYRSTGNVIHSRTVK